MKPGLTILLSLTVIVSLTSPAMADGDVPGPQAPDATGLVQDITNEAEQFLGDGKGSGGVGGLTDGISDVLSPDLNAARCHVMQGMEGLPDPMSAPPGSRDAGCAAPDPAPPGEDGEEPEAPALPGLRATLRGLQDEAQGIAREVEDAATGSVEETRSLLGRLGEEASRMARQTADAIESVYDDAAAKTERAVQQAMAVLSALLRPITNLLNEPQAGGSMPPGTMVPASAVEAPVVPVSKMALGAVLAGGIGLALAAFAALRRLLGLGSVALLSRIPSAEIMKNETRSQIHDIVKSDPGVSLNEIVTRMGISRNAVAYHLAVFESEELMTSVKDGKYRRYFLNGGKYANGAKDVVSTIKNGVTRNVIRFIAEHPGVIQKDVCEAVGTSPSATSWHIRRLEKVGLVEKERVANMVRYRPGPSIARYDLSDFGLAAATQAGPAPLPAPAEAPIAA